MKYIIDTHALVWIIDNNSQLSQRVKEIYLDEDNEILLSIASIWEMALKISLKKLTIPGSLSDLVENTEQTGHLFRFYSDSLKVFAEIIS